MITVILRASAAVVAQVVLVCGHGSATSSPASSQPAGETDARAELIRACQRQADALRKKLDAECDVHLDPPFVLAGDLGRAPLIRWSRHVVRHASEAMWRRYFSKRPARPIVILLFGSQRSYRAYAKRLFNDTEVPYYGYYRPELGTMVMNISTGGGTLIHELTHALIAYDFPKVPDWLNEGLASLHEQCGHEPWERGELVGEENWRLPSLQKAIASRTLRPLRELMTADDFRGPLETLNYAQARYFCMYLQRRGVLADFYKAFRDGYKDDHTGLSYAEEVMGRRRIEAVEQDFLAWVRQLRYRP